MRARARPTAGLGGGRPASRAGSVESGETKVGRSVARRRPAATRPGWPGRRPPTARCGTRRLRTRPSRPAARRPPRSGSMRSTDGSANGVWVKWAVRRSGRSRASVEPMQGQVVVLDEDPAPLGRHLGHPLGEQLVEARGRRPRPPATAGRAGAGGRRRRGGGGRTTAWRWTPRCRPGCRPRGPARPARCGARRRTSARPRRRPGRPRPGRRPPRWRPVPTTRGRSEPARPPADVPATGRPSSKWKASGPRLETRTVSASEPSPQRGVRVLGHARDATR